MTVPSWGERFRAAYLASKRRFGHEAVSYRAVSGRIQGVGVPVSDTAIMRLCYMDEMPRDPKLRQQAYLSLAAMGYDPTDGFGLTSDDRGVDLTPDELRRFLDPGVAT